MEALSQNGRAFFMLAIFLRRLRYVHIKDIGVSPLGCIVIVHPCPTRLGIEQRVAVHHFCVSTQHLFNVQKIIVMNENLILTKDSVPADIERYFRGVLALDQQDKVFSVNLDDVWRLAYNRKDAAVRALKANFIENVDYLTLPQNVERSEDGTFISGRTDYYLTSACLEYFVARKVRPVFEVYRRVFHHAVAQVNQQPSLQEQIQAKLAFADWSAKFLNLNEASKLGIAQKIGKIVGLDDALPQSVNAGTEKPITHAATDLLKSHNVGISAQAFNRMLELKGVVKHATRPGKRGKVHSWYVITPAFDKYGQNQQDPKFQQQTQIRWYDATFMELLTIVGLNSQTSLNLN